MRGPPHSSVSPASCPPGGSPAFLMPDETFTSPAQVAILLTTIATLVYQFVREGRRHKWEEEAKVRHAEATAKAEAERLDIAQRVKDAETNLNAKLDENTEISRKAFTEANHVNEKLAAQNAAFDKLLAVALSTTERRAAPAGDKALKKTIDHTAEQVSDIHQRVVEDA